MESISVKGQADLYINFISGIPYVIQQSKGSLRNDDCDGNEIERQKSK